jgi:hypothetical protein
MTLGQDGTGGTSGSYIQSYSGGTASAIGTSGYRLLLQPYGSSVIVGGTADNGNRFQVNGVSNFTGSVGIGTTNPADLLEVKGSITVASVATSQTYINMRQGSSGTYNCSIMTYDHSGDGYYDGLSLNGYDGVSICTGANTRQERMRITSGGSVGIGTSSPNAGYKLTISAGDSSHTLYGPNSTWVYYYLACGSGSSQITNTTAQVTVTNGNLHLDAAASGAAGRGLYLNYYTSANGQSGGNGSSILSYGPFVHTGSFSVSVGPKSFKIPHPTVPNKDLIHSCIEGPRVDLIYRGTVTLVNGTGTVNMNKNSTTTPDCAMTDGTFEALCTNPQFFLQNMSGFDRVRGTMSGANLVIISENQTSTDVISWMVVAERHDAGMISADLTNDAGYLITEQDSLPSNPYSSPPPS